MIEPLLKAFEETKEEKDELLSNYKHSYDEFSKRCKEIAIENDTLRQQMQESKLKVRFYLVAHLRLRSFSRRRIALQLCVVKTQI